MVISFFSFAFAFNEVNEKEFIKSSISGISNGPLLKPFFEVLILSKQITRDGALEELQRPAIPASEQLELEEYVMKKMGLTKQEYDKIIHDKPRSFKDYPNDEWIIKLYKKYGLTNDEIAFIDSMIRPMDLSTNESDDE